MVITELLRVSLSLLVELEFDVSSELNIAAFLIVAAIFGSDPSGRFALGRAVHNHIDVLAHVLVVFESEVSPGVNRKECLAAFGPRERKTFRSRREIVGELLGPLKLRLLSASRNIIPRWYGDERRQ